MSYAHVLIVNTILENRHKFIYPDQIKEICGILFDLSLRDYNAAEALLEKPNLLYK